MTLQFDPVITGFDCQRAEQTDFNLLSVFFCIFSFFSHEINVFNRSAAIFLEMQKLI